MTIMHRHPYDEELREIALKYAAVLRIIVETVDRHGLKSHFLTKHLSAVEKLFKWIETAGFASEIAQSYQKRFRKNREKLFSRPGKSAPLPVACGMLRFLALF
jgi:hypothetical protein